MLPATDVSVTAEVVTFPSLLPRFGDGRSAVERRDAEREELLLPEERCEPEAKVEGAVRVLARQRSGQQTFVRRAAAATGDREESPQRDDSVEAHAPRVYRADRPRPIPQA